MDTADIDTAIVLAGGLGTRLRAAVPDLPKPMAPIGARPFLEYLFDYWIGEGIGRFVLSVGYKADLIRAHFGDRYRSARIDYATEFTPLGTGGGLLLAARQLGAGDAPVLILNGDTFFAVRLAELVRAHQAHHADWTFALFRTRESGRYMGMALNDDGSLASLAPIDRPGERLANGGVYLAARNVLARPGPEGLHPLSLETDLLPSLLAAGARLCGIECAASFIDIGVPDDYRRAAGLLAQASLRRAE